MHEFSLAITVDSRDYRAFNLLVTRVLFMVNCDSSFMCLSWRCGRILDLSGSRLGKRHFKRAFVRRQCLCEHLQIPNEEDVLEEQA